MESEESERFLFLLAPLMTPSLHSAYDLVKTRLSEAEAEAEGKFNHNISSHSLECKRGNLRREIRRLFSLDC